jgi:hypothetical protein
LNDEFSRTLEMAFMKGLGHGQALSPEIGLEAAPDKGDRSMVDLSRPGLDGQDGFKLDQGKGRNQRSRSALVEDASMNSDPLSLW